MIVEVEVMKIPQSLVKPERVVSRVYYAQGGRKLMQSFGKSNLSVPDGWVCSRLW